MAQLAPPACQVPGCEYITEFGLSEMINSHMETHSLTHKSQIDPKSVLPEKMKRSEISSACTSEDWYKGTTNIERHELITQLTNCCDKHLGQDLFRSYGTNSEKTEDEVLSDIKELSVR
ncbi:unnamed protein product [Meganyctiphanes norvegica]|uniref:Uncharacterized protein n=1 Tax=Meganyctiphanes norvegica TaxID=48144 RepID=A0AAV2STB5_MEGNR